MSRRKQTKPRHLDDTGDLGDSLANVMTEPSNPTDMNGLDEVDAADGQEGPDELSEVSEIIPSVSGSRLTPTDTDSISPVQGTNDQTDENLNEEVADDDLKEDYRCAKYEGEPDSRYQSPSHELEHEQDVNIDGTGSNEGLLNEERDAEVMDMDDDDEEDDDDDDEDDDIQQMPQMPFFPGAAAMLPHLFSGSNVKLEQLQGTKVAVAQFAENNMAPSEFAMLQSALFTLHQQQLLQLQMLQQIQHHLMSGASGILPVMSSSSTLASLPSTTVFTTAVATTSQLNQTTSDANKENRTPHNVHNRIADTVLTPSGQLKRSASHLDMPEAPSPLLPPTGTPLGQDSGSNIFKKSERPYKCNVCGNRFSTKGNLKVHFQRHKEKYPHIMMNPNPTPEHLEHQPQMPPPLIPGHCSTPLSTPLMSPSHPSPGMKMPHETPLTPNIPMPTPKMDDRHQDRDHVERERVSQVPLTPVQTSPSPPKVDTPASSSSDAAPRPVSKPASAAPSDSSSSPVSSALTPLSAMSNMMASTPPMPLPGTFPGLVPPFSSPFGFEPPFMRGSILPQKTEDPMEQYMEIDKSSETRKLEQLVKNIESKLSDPNECAICHRILSCKSALQMHYRTHTGERPFKCKICGRAFTTKGNLKTHMGVHRAKPPLRMMHQCPVCHKQFTNALVLQQHIRMHTSDIPTELKLQNEMMAAATMGFMRPPYPGMPPMPIPMPHGMGAPQHQIPTMPGGELDLRKPPVDMMRHPMTSDKSPTTDHEDSHLGDNLEYEKDDPHDDPEMQGYDNEAVNGEHEQFKDNEDEEDFLKQREDEEFSKHEEQDNTEQMVKEEDQVVQEENDAMDTDHQDGEKSHDDPPVLSSPSHVDEKMETSMERSESVPVGRDEEQPPKEYVDPTSKYMSDYSNYLNTPSSDSQTPLYSTSLMALEERVKAIEHMAATPSFHSQLYGNPYQQHSSTSPNMVPGLSRESTPTRASLSGGSEERTTPLSKGGTPNPVDGSVNMNSSESMDGEGSNLSGYRGFGGLEYGSRPFEMVTGRMNTTCNVCYKTFACKSALDIHYRSHTKERPFRCEVCDRGFSTKGNMRQHMLTHKIRDLPNQSVPSGDQGTALPPSLPVKTESSPPQTSVSVTTPPAYVTSAPLVPVPAVVPPAPVSTTPSPPTSTNPALSPRSTTKPALDTSPFVRKPKLNHVCQMCQKPFSSASALQIHIRTHTGDKPFKCTVCGKAFTTKGNLKVHMGTHMWNNSPSRRGRRMSVDLAALTSPAKDPDYYRRFAHQPPEMYPFPFSPYANGYSPKMNEIPVIQNLNGGLSRMPPPPASMGDMMPSPYSVSIADNGHQRKSPTYPASMSDSNHSNKSPPAPVDTKPTPTKTSPSEAASYPVPASYLPMVNPYNNNNNKVRTAPNGELDLSIKKVATPPSSGDSPPEPQEAPGATWPWMPPPAVEPSTSKPLMA